MFKVQVQAYHLLLFVFLSLTLVQQPAASSEIGSVDKATGWREIVRDKKSIQPDKGSDVISNDDIRTGEGRLEVRFVDDSKLRLTEHTRIVIDNVVFDDDPSKSDLAMTFAQGTARFVSGGIGKINKENVRLRTPTASIGIRGTDFTVTVDEFGRTLVVLLPDVNGISSGEIIVSTMTGEVTLNKPFQSTTTSVMEASPSAPAILNLTLDMLDNILIINPPRERMTADEFATTINADGNINPLDVDFLNEELLDNADLNEDLLEYTELDINYLDVNLLEDLLDVYDKLNADNMLDDQQSSGDFIVTGTSEGYDSVTQVVTVVDGDSVKLQRALSSTLQINLRSSANVSLNIDQDGKEIDPIQVNSGNDTTINISQ
jgi:hypothetical protein